MSRFYGAQTLYTKITASKFGRVLGCSYCGQKNKDDSSFCSGCGSALETPINSTARESIKKWAAVFCWIPTAIMLWTIAAISLMGVALNVLLIILARQGKVPDHFMGGPVNIPEFIRSIRDFSMVAGSCLVSWHLMKRRTRAGLSASIFLILFAVFVSVRDWIAWDRSMASSIKYVELLFYLSCLVYPGVFAWLERGKLAD